jgi:phage gpG-like protein
MIARLHITNASLAGFSREVKERIKAAQPKAELAMAESFQEAVLSNFGATGKYRPWSGWPPLSPAYAKKVGRDYATLEVSGRLKANVLLELNGAGNFEVTSDDERVPYATVHQTGGGNNIPQREYFPMHDDGTVYRQVSDLVQDAAEAALLKELL